MNHAPYMGQELDVFAHATNWKNYWSSQIREYLGGNVLEVGAGLGANTPFLYSQQACSWTCLEPDASLAARMKARFASHPELMQCRVLTGTLKDIDSGSRFDAILYIDVLEHIEDDCREMELAASHLSARGRIIVLAPAHQRLFTPFDQAIGHFRRYDRVSLTRCTPGGCQLERMSYLDSVGLLATLGNHLVLRQSDPSLKQILLWDRFLVRASRLVDRLSFHLIGKSILGVWKKIDSRETP